jgi:hypothetical protein
MGTSLTGLTPATTYDALIKVGDNGPLSATAKVLSDGLGNDSILALSTSQVGVGTNSPSRTLDVNGVIRTQNAGSAGAPSIELGTSPQGNGLFSPTTNTLAFTTNDNECMRLTSAGNVGIGTTTPSAKLEISGNSSDTDFRISRTVDPTANLYISAPGGATLTSIFGISGTNIFSIDTNKYIRLASASGGIQFNGDTASANALDDYEEGTWTMGVAFGGASVGVTYSSNTGTYTKIGRQVTVNGYMALTNKGSSTGIVRITGLPFTIQNSISHYACASLWLNSVTFANQYNSVGAIGTTNIAIEEITEAGVVTQITNSDFANNSEVIVSFTYFV